MQFVSIAGGFELNIPHSVVAVYLGLIAGAPWITYIPNRFSMRTLIIAMTIIALATGLTVWAIKR